MENQILILQAQVGGAMALEKVGGRFPHLNFETLGVAVADDLPAQDGGNPQLAEAARQHDKLAILKVDESFPIADGQPEARVLPHPRAMLIALLDESGVRAVVS